MGTQTTVGRNVRLNFEAVPLSLRSTASLCVSTYCQSLGCLGPKAVAVRLRVVMITDSILRTNPRAQRILMPHLNDCSKFDVEQHARFSASLYACAGAIWLTKGTLQRAKQVDLELTNVKGLSTTRYMGQGR